MCFCHILLVPTPLSQAAAVPLANWWDGRCVPVSSCRCGLPSPKRFPGHWPRPSGVAGLQKLRMTALQWPHGDGSFGWEARRTAQVMGGIVRGSKRLFHLTLRALSPFYALPSTSHRGSSPTPPSVNPWALVSLEQLLCSCGGGCHRNRHRSCKGPRQVLCAGPGHRAMAGL